MLSLKHEEQDDVYWNIANSDDTSIECIIQYRFNGDPDEYYSIRCFVDMFGHLEWDRILQETSNSVNISRVRIIFKFLDSWEKDILKILKDGIITDA